ncbi:MAG: hypothetical protein Q605_AUC00847G0004 [Actinomyces urogenitalis DORA_12]|uniref:Uncharacterized protein n=1 Tax=Actinomyces urogenitalis DORA_12 TaxID=1403939 RepID=W1VEZ3_9ACTO|nr:MAG: hypothetical protein Q605_AUC00847G0004 [Actinomyces urogenitalis DORA_12]
MYPVPWEKVMVFCVEVRKSMSLMAFFLRSGEMPATSAIPAPPVGQEGPGPGR